MEHLYFHVTHFVLLVISIGICEADFRKDLANEIVIASTILTDSISDFLKLFNKQNQIVRPLNFLDFIKRNKNVAATMVLKFFKFKIFFVIITYVLNTKKNFAILFSVENFKTTP